MKIFNISVRVTATMIAEIPDNRPEPAEPEKKPFNDDPLDKQARLLDRYLDRFAEIQRGPVIPYPGEGPDGATMAQNARVAAESFDDLAAILKKFADVLRGLPSVPESLVQSQSPPIRVADH